MELIPTLTALEQNQQLHAGRLLVLLRAFAGPEGTQTIEGITKLAKLDFFLRYPNMLERALQARNASTRDVVVREHEKDSVESAMVRFRYGPWDHRFRRFVNLLVAQGLALVQLDGRTVEIGLTGRGLLLANQLADSEAYGDVARRSRLLKTHLDLSATNLMNFVYKTFPEISSLRWGEESPSGKSRL